jgi:hypothetical protein
MERVLNWIILLLEYFVVVALVVMLATWLVDLARGFRPRR